MSTEFEMEYDNNTLFVGEIELVDDSFDHEFGTERIKSAETQSFHVIVYINDIDYDVTASIPEKTLESWREIFIQRYITEMREV